MTTTTFHAPAALPNILAPFVTAVRFTGHFLLALLSVIFLGSAAEH